MQTAWGTHYSVWSYYRTVTVSPGSGVSSAETNFPLLVHLTSSDAVWATCNTNGYDIQFTQTDGVTPLPVQRAYWNYSTTTGCAEFWVLMPTVAAAGTPTTFRMYWGNSGATDASSGSAVFSLSNNYSAVWHMNAAQGSNEPDATGYAISQTALVQGSPTNVTGPGGVPSSVGKAITSGNYYTISNSGSGSNLDFNPGGPYTLSCWINPTSASQATAGIIGKLYLNAGNVYDGTYQLAYRYSINGLQFCEVFGSATASTDRIYVSEPSINKWHY